MYYLVIYIILIDIIKFVILDNVKYCTNSICQNGGTCMLMNPTPSYTECHEWETYFNGKCYDIIREPFAWNDADSRCRRKNGENATLAKIEDQSTRNFISYQLWRNVTRESKAYRNIGFWIGLKHISNPRDNLPAKWKWMPSGKPIKLAFWQHGMPKIQNDKEGICVSLNFESRFDGWKSQSCGDLNYFVCERTANKGSNDWLVQCECPTNYEGQYCENYVQNNKPRSVCENGNFIFTCPTGQAILVDFALYGHVSNEITTCGMSSPFDTCIDPSSLQTMIQRCEGLAFCEAANIKEIFKKRPCVDDIPISLHYRMRCTNEIPNRCSHQDSVYIQGRCYYVAYQLDLNNRKTYSDARAYCGINGGDLANPNSDTVYSMLYNMLNSTNTEPELYWIKNQDNGQYLLLKQYPTDKKKQAALCTAVRSTSTISQPTECDQKLNWICEYPPIGPNTIRIRERLSQTTSTTTSTVETATTISNGKIMKDSGAQRIK